MSAPRFSADNTPSHPEFRRHARGRLACTVHLLLPNRRIVEARTVDISVGGLRLLTPANLPIKLLCGVKLTVPGIPSGSHTILAQAQVTNAVFSGRESGFLVGLRFTMLPPAGLRAVSAYLSEKFRHTAYRGRPSRPLRVSADERPADTRRTGRPGAA